MAKTLKEMIEVMEWFEGGGTVECVGKGYDDWERTNKPLWNWDDFEYRAIKFKPKVMIEKWLIEENDIKFVVETSDIDSWLKSFPTAQKLKLIESYEVEI